MRLTGHLPHGRSRPVVGMLTQDLFELFAEEWLGAVDGADTNGCDLVCFCGRALEAPGFGRQANAIYDMVTTEVLDGLVIWTSVLAIYVGQDRMEEFCRRFGRLPIVSVEQSLGDAPVVQPDNRQGMDAAVTHLIEAHGCRRIAFVRGPENHAGARERYGGYLDALARHGLTAPPGMVSTPPEYWLPEVAAEEVTRILARGEPPDGIAGANDDLAVATLSALAAAGVRAPVVGFDDFTNIRTHDLGFDSDTADETIAVRRAVNVNASALSLTTVRSPLREMGRRAVEMVLGMLRGEAVPSVVTVPTQLVVRRSCGCLPIAPAQAVAGPIGRDHAATRLRQALARQPADLPDDWPESLAAAFIRDLRGESHGGFLREMDGLIQLTLRAGESVEDWYRVLFALRHLIARHAATGAETTRAEEIWLSAEMLLNETADRQRRYVQVLTDKRNLIVREVGQRLVTASDVVELADFLADELPKLGIPGCYLAMYEPSAARSRLLLAYENEAPTEVAAAEALFESARLVPGDRLHRADPSSWVAVPLFFKEERLGFALFELGPRVGWIYVALQEQLSTALHRALLAERERAAVAAVTEAHRREERHRLAGELHDSVSQALFSMTLHTRAVELAVDGLGLDPTGPVVRGLRNLRELTQGALTEMRALIFQLRPDALHEEGLVVAIGRHAAAVAARQGFEVRVHASADRLPLAEPAEVELFRIVQEALHNSVKHARPDLVEIRLFEAANGAGTLVVEVADNGVGFDPDLPRPGHLGLNTMRERAQRLGGQFTVDSSPAGSTTVRVVVPGALVRPA